MRKVAALGSAALLTILLLAVPARAAMGPAPFTRHTDLARDYFVYEPAAGGAGRPLVVYLHGCNQTAADAATGTRWTELAEARGFTAVFPEQSATANGAQCWNWFLPEHQVRDAGEPAIVAEITRRVIARTGSDPTRVYVLGASAGADLAMIMGATYPDLYAAVVGFAGCAYATCADVDGTRAHAAQGSQARVLPAMLVQGTADPLNDFAMGETMARQWVGTNDLGDDGEANGSVPSSPSRTEHVGLDASAADGAGTAADLCVRNRQFPCASGLRANGDYPYSIEHHADRSGCDVVDFWIVHGLSHDYPGGDPEGSFTDPAGPHVTTAAYDWFLRHRLGVPCAGAFATTSAPAPGPAPVAMLPLTGGADPGPAALVTALLVLAGRRRRRRRGHASPWARARCGTRPPRPGP